MRTKIKNILIIVIEALVMVGLFCGFFIYLNMKESPRQVYKFTRTINAGQQIMSGDIQEVNVPGNAVDSSFATGNNIVGSYVSTTVYQDTYVYTQELATKNAVSPFKGVDESTRKITIPVTTVTAVGGSIKSGDYVDIVYTGKVPNSGVKQSNGIYSDTFMQNIQVYSVGQANDSTSSNSSSVSKSADSSMVTLLVTLEQYEEIQTRLKTGSIELVGRFSNSKIQGDVPAYVYDADNNVHGLMDVE